MMPVLLPALITVLLGGAAVAVQAPINAGLGRFLGDPVLAAWASFGVGLAGLTIACLFRGTWSGLAASPTIPWWAWIGGLLGAFYVVGMTWSVPQLGVVSAFAALLLGQMVTALYLDATGAFGLTVRPITWERTLAIALVIGGLILSRR